MAEPTIADRIEESAKAGIAEARADGTSVEAMLIDDQIKAAEYVKKGDASSKNHLGLTFRTLRPGGTG